MAEVASQQEELQATKIEAETRFEELDTEIATLQEAYSEAEMAGEALADEAQTARDRLRDQERGAQEAEFNERGIRARIAELQRNLQVATEQNTRAKQELITLESDLTTLDAAAAEAGLQEALELRAEREEALGRVRIEMDTLAAQLREADEERLMLERSLEPRRERIKVTFTFARLNEFVKRCQVHRAQTFDFFRDALHFALQPGWARPLFWLIDQ